MLTMMRTSVNVVTQSLLNNLQRSPQLTANLMLKTTALGFPFATGSTRSLMASSSSSSCSAPKAPIGCDYLCTELLPNSQRLTNSKQFQKLSPVIIASRFPWLFVL
ncbi:MAG: hypothetical protein MHMPM18_001942 [Marteilia pararefringens]